MHDDSTYFLYLSGGVIDKTDSIERKKEVETFFEMQEEAVKVRVQGYTIINPIKIDLALPVELLDMAMDIHFRLIDRCQVVYMIPGWKKDIGACMEYGYARGKGKIVKETLS